MAITCPAKAARAIQTVPNRNPRQVLAGNGDPGKFAQPPRHLGVEEWTHPRIARRNLGVRIVVRQNRRQGTLFPSLQVSERSRHL